MNKRVWGAMAPVFLFLAMGVSQARAESYGSSSGEVSPARPGMGEREIKDEAARMSLAPHTLMVETELLSALDQLRGLKAQLKTAQAQPTPEFLEHYRVHRREINDSVKSVRTHEGELKERANRFPTIARSEQYRALDPAIVELERMNQQWERQVGNRAYWSDTAKVNADIDQLEKRLMTALEKTRNLNSKLDVSEVG